MRVFESKKQKFVISDSYNSVFNKQNGFFMRWGKTKDDDPGFCPFGSEILDMEISSGACHSKCKFCYKSNGSGEAINMSFDTFKKIFNVLTETKILTQIAFGITDINTNSAFFNMMQYAREHEVIPNYTTSGFQVTKEIAKKTAELCGAVAISIHDKETAFNAIKLYLDAGMKQVNVHWVVMKENIQETLDIIKELKTDERTKNLNALVLLAYKPKGRNKEVFTPITNINDYKKIIKCAEDNNMNLGFDSCSVPNVLRSYTKDISAIVDPCESTLFSFYCNVNGEFFPCSFAEGEGKWKQGISINEIKTLKDLWYHNRIIDFRNNLLHSTDKCSSCTNKKICRHCMIYTIADCYTLENK
jgi:radical SAM protein with 4Fe4S-binding SPASM domain